MQDAIIVSLLTAFFKWTNTSYSFFKDLQYEFSKVFCVAIHILYILIV
jgi:hypothetical protein